MKIIKMFKIAIASFALTLLALSPAQAGFGDDYGCKSKKNAYEVNYDKGWNGNRYRSVGVVIMKSTLQQKQVTPMYKKKRLWWGGLRNDGISRHRNNRPVQTCTGECGAAGCGGSFGAVDCLDHDICGNHYKAGGGPFDKNCGDEFLHGINDYVEAYMVNSIRKLFNREKCERIWK